MGRLLIRRILLTCGAALLILFLGSIAFDLTARPDEVCDWCGKTMKFDYSFETGSATLEIYQCDCDQRGQRALLHSGGTSWMEW
jgi:hypothetical protein